MLKISSPTLFIEVASARLSETCCKMKPEGKVIDDEPVIDDELPSDEGSPL